MSFNYFPLNHRPLSFDLSDQEYPTFFNGNAPSQPGDREIINLRERILPKANLIKKADYDLSEIHENLKNNIYSILKDKKKFFLLFCSGKKIQEDIVKIKVKDNILSIVCWKTKFKEMKRATEILRKIFTNAYEEKRNFTILPILFNDHYYIKEKCDEVISIQGDIENSEENYEYNEKGFAFDFYKKYIVKNYKPLFKKLNLNFENTTSKQKFLTSYPCIEQIEKDLNGYEIKWNFEISQVKKAHRF